MIRKTHLKVSVRGQQLQGNLNIPLAASSLVICANASFNSRFSTRNRYITEALNREGIATLLIDLLTEVEAHHDTNHFDMNALVSRLIAITGHSSNLFGLRGLPIAYLATDIGGAAALGAAAQLGDKVQAIVCRAGRPDLVPNLIQVEASTLLIVGSNDPETLALNQEAFSLLRCRKRLEVVQGASHLFEEAGKLNDLVALTTGWLRKHLQAVLVADVVQ